MSKLLYSTPPKSLKSLQEWFAGIISQPLEDGSEIAKNAPNGRPIAREAARHIAPSPTQKPHERIRIYNQQYWWRLLKNLQEGFPLLVRLFGYHDFNRLIATPYLMRHRPNHWSLNYLGSRLPEWIKENYLQADAQLVYNSASLDEAFTASFIAPQHPPINVAQILQEGGTDRLLSLKLYLQPHIWIFRWNYDLFAFREEMLKEIPEHWSENDFPLLPKERPYSYVLYREKNNLIYWKEISSSQALLLQLFKKGCTVECACESLENENQSIYEEALQNLQDWFQIWTALGWFSEKQHLSIQ